MKYLVGIFFLIFAVINGRRTINEFREGEAYLVVSAAGDGLAGRAARSEEPVAFWFNIAVHGVVVTAAALGGLWFLFWATNF
jgi:hypothetical protein